MTRMNRTSITQLALLESLPVSDFDGNCAPIPLKDVSKFVRCCDHEGMYDFNGRKGIIRVALYNIVDSEARQEWSLNLPFEYYWRLGAPKVLVRQLNFENQQETHILRSFSEYCDRL